MARSRKVPVRRAPQATSFASAWDVFHARKETSFSYHSTKDKAMIFNSATIGVVVVPRTACILHESDWPITIEKSVYRVGHVVWLLPQPIAPATSKGSLARCIGVLLDLWGKGYSPTSFSLSHYSMGGSTTTFWAWHTIVSQYAIAHANYTRTRLKTLPLLSIASGDERAQHIVSESALNFFEAVINCLVNIADLVGSKTLTHTCSSCISSIPEICQLASTIIIDCKLHQNYILPIREVSTILSSILD